MKTKRDRPARRVVIGLMPAMLDAAALAAAARLARSAGAELAALFVEDSNLLRLASLPFAQEIGAASAARRRLVAADIERALKVQAAQLKRALADAAERLELQWTFEILRGQGLGALLECAGATDFVVLAGSGRRPRLTPALEDLLKSTSASNARRQVASRWHSIAARRRCVCLRLPMHWHGPAMPNCCC